MKGAAMPWVFESDNPASPAGRFLALLRAVYAVLDFVDAYEDRETLPRDLARELDRAFDEFLRHDRERYRRRDPLAFVSPN